MAPLFHHDLRYITILRRPIKRLLSHYRMGTKEVNVEGYWSGSPFKREVTLREFATGPVTDCPLCKASQVCWDGSCKTVKTNINGSKS